VVEQPPGAVGGVENPFRLEAFLLKQGSQGAGLAFVRHQIDVRIVTAEGGACRR
jgi:hypothetical protein